jgi:hypothetical protein
MADDKKVPHICRIACGWECLYLILSANSPVEALDEARSIARKNFPRWRRKSVVICEQRFAVDFNIKM